jgi:peptide/nickel transport system substrate-binding protein
VSVSEDGKVHTFTIREGVTFHDGTPLTAEDIAFTYTFYKEAAGFPFIPAYLEQIESAVAPDPQTLVVTLLEAIPNLDVNLRALYVLPKHIWSEVDPATAAEFTNDAMIGTGPFKLVEYKQNEFVRLEANDGYFGGRPKVDAVIFQTFDNQDAMVQALRTGQVDMITEMPNTAVATLRNAENIKVVAGAPMAPSVTDIILNVTAPENCPADTGLCTGHPALQDLAVRQALAHATDKQQIIDVVLLGLGTPGLTLLPDGLGVFYNNSLTDYAFDIAEANRLLDEAGYLDSDGDGIREMPDSDQALVFRLNWPSDSADSPRIAELLGNTWNEIGVGIEPSALDPDALTAVCCPAFDFDLIIWGWGTDPDPSFLLSVMTTDEIPTGTSESGYSNPEYDELYVAQSVALDKDKRIELVWQMQEIVHRDLPYIIPFYAQSVQAYRTDRFSGWQDDAPRLALEDVSSLTVIEPVK